MDDLLADFLTETHEGLSAVDEALLRLERAPDDAPTLAEIFRQVHTIKGTCGFLGLTRLEKVAHAAETMLGLYRDGSLKVTPEGITLIFAAADAIRQIVLGLEQHGQEPEGDDAAVIAALDAAARGESAALPSAPQPKAEAPLDATPAPNAAPIPAPRTQETAAEAAHGESAAAQQTIRVSVEVLEDLMTLVSELVLTRNQLMQLARVSSDSQISVPLQRLSHITSELQEGVMKTRMQPIGNAWAKLPRLVRDLANELGKKIELEMRGADTELDRQVLELIKDPLTHMVRNSGDHGLEKPADRRAAGKPETGRILLNAYHQGGHIIIEIGDDGRGLPVEKIRAKALAQGLATEAELAQMSEHDVLRFIFRPGFSTAQQITSVSGRGVGMDVVKTNIERIGGTIELRSKEGRGTTFTIKIPLTLAIVSALIVQAGGERFAIPQIGVVELVRVGDEHEGNTRIEMIKDAPVLRLRDRLLPLVSLSALLRLREAPVGGLKGYVVVMQVGANVFGIVVDRVFDTEEIVVKPVAPILRHITMFSGNTILGDGSVIMILDPNGVARGAGISAEGRAEEQQTISVTGGIRSDSSTSLLLFRAGDHTPKAVPLGLVARLEDIPVQRIEMSGGTPVVQYRGQLMPMVPIAGHWEASASGRQAVLVFTEGQRSMGLMVDEILDVVEEPLLIQPGSDRLGYLGSAVISERVTDVIDTVYWLSHAGGDWFRGDRKSSASHQKPRLLLIDDSPFFRHLVVPALSAAGFDVTAVESPAEALRLRDAGAEFEALISDIEMPEMDGLSFARNVRASGAWTRLPLVALSSRAEADDVARGREAGFTDYVVKYDRDALLSSLHECLSSPIAA
ncbi:MAG: hybrid sensor histidine kinase/response regulator [Roseomonas sp.]|nr:hybrid sensor histidine kinase/response regulator [Roseomonas sp.]MCA3329282.1 hybrid sensor histidine kinase/response regulator [Roseomonas sp.]MCA3329697.1 hybrid sensor histidine kinase/response regulator [Roseomonas sp.]MCA3334446.1 hybrid sensor histidine kinase/response regulator [Roseomonas sp.]MCA3347146.1 hybrid sensor histidine kinase/response regulator [Roseomonas sp.]